MARLKLRLPDWSHLPEAIWYAVWGEGKGSPSQRVKERDAKKNLEDLRRRMAFIQPDLFYVAFARALLITQVALAKMREGLEVYSSEQHMKVIQEWDEMCADLAMPEEMVKNLMHPLIVAIMDLSVSYQELMKSDPNILKVTEDYLEFVYEGLKAEYRKTHPDAQPARSQVG